MDNESSLNERKKERKKLYSVLYSEYRIQFSFSHFKIGNLLGRLED